jgi:carboxylate-amine ligase
MGIEEEFLVVDAVTRRPVGLAEELLVAGRAEGLESTAGTDLQRELLTSQLEAASGVCTSIPDLASLVTRARRTLARLAGERGLLLVPTGTPPLPGIDPVVTRGPRFLRGVEIYAVAVTGYEVSGCHVHVGVADADTAVAVVNHLRPWLPTLLALSANSPFWHGRDSGYASWRMMEQARFPGSGVPPRFADAEDYRREVSRLVECGVLIDRSMSFWLARPSPHLPTVEFRVADAAATVGEAMLQAALSRALVVTALAELAAGREGPPTDDQVCAAAVWSAARHGMTGPAVSPFACRSVPAVRMVDQLVRWVRPALEDSGDLPLVRRELALLARHGTGAARQLRAAEKGLEAVVDRLAITPGGG